ncbi:MAG: hypothetical protein COB98_07885 [Flavobacteriaceae bacterium]|nr:MAG: hypothetical protein COB98_07885 [Flavobacteriaceae bacterium]
MFASCAKKEIQIPLIAADGIQEIKNFSEVWVFFEVEKNDTLAVLNRTNTIISTNWVYNIDKKLPMNKVLPVLKKMKYKHKNGMHADKKTLDFYSYSNTENNMLSFLEFTQVKFMGDSTTSKELLKLEGEAYAVYHNLNLKFYKNTVYINDSDVGSEDLKQTLLEFIEFSSEGRQTLIHLNFDDTLTYQEYLSFKTMVASLQSAAIKISVKEFIFDRSKIPDCNC